MIRIKTEHEIQTEILKYLDANVIFHFRKTQMGGDKKGISDIVACYKGYYVAIEVKKPTKYKISLAQEKHKELLLRNKGNHVYAFCVGDVENLFKEIDVTLNDFTKLTKQQPTGAKIIPRLKNRGKETT